ncbi:MAG: nuclear transport factor 2 family protein [Candidatus Abyssubacteria bacterium]|nr:nuclear transport factor 2 family protein [Candidatus Abyssubacteria bacterium]
MTESQATTLAERFRAAVNRFEADQPETLEFFTDDIVYSEPRFPAFRGKEALKGYLQQLMGKHKALQASWEYTNVVVQGDQAAVEWMVRSGVDFGGKKLEIPGASFFKVRDGKICYYCEYYDTAILQQLAE